MKVKLPAETFMERLVDWGAWAIVYFVVSFMLAFFWFLVVVGWGVMLLARLPVLRRLPWPGFLKQPGKSRSGWPSSGQGQGSQSQGDEQGRRGQAPPLIGNDD